MTYVSGGLPGTLVVTMTFVFVGVIVQFLIGLGLALLVTQNLRGKRFFRVVFLLPMMITPVGIGFLFRMMTDTLQGPGRTAVGCPGVGRLLMDADGLRKRAAVIIGDTWQWTPFIFIVLLAALEGVPREPVEAALVDGANRWQVFRFVIVPQLIPVSLTVIDDPHHRRLQDRRHAAGTHARWTRNRHRIGDAPGVELVARPRSRGLGGDGLPVALRGHVHLPSSLSTSSANA